MAVGTGWLIGVVFGAILWTALQLMLWKRVKEKQKKEAAMMKYFEKE